MNWGPSGSSYDEDEGYVDFEDEEQPTSNYGLRGSSFDEQSEANEKWKTTYCQAEKRAAVWEQRMKEGTKEERAKARERYAEAKAASAKAWSRISKEGKSAWDAVKNKSTSIGKSIGKKTELGARRLPVGLDATVWKMKMSSKKCMAAVAASTACLSSNNHPLVEHSSNLVGLGVRGTHITNLFYKIENDVTASIASLPSLQPYVTCLHQPSLLQYVSLMPQKTSPIYS